jgi:SAM-dependent methyltransferase
MTLAAPGQERRTPIHANRHDILHNAGYLSASPKNGTDVLGALHAMAAMTSVDLDKWARVLSEAADRAAAHRANETELREDLDPLVRRAAAELYGLSDRDTTAERRVGGGKSRRRYDRAYGGLVVEWEWSMGGARRRHAAEQAVDYLSLMRADLGVDEAFSAVVTDGCVWGFLASDLPDAQLSLTEPNLQPEQRFEWRENSPAACRRFLVLLGSNRQSAVTASGLASAFGPQGGTARRVVALLSEAMSGRRPDDRADTLYCEWRRSLEVVYGNLDDRDGKLANTVRETFDLGGRRSLGELLFVVHTFFALIVRLVAIEVLSISAQDEASQPTTWSSLPDAELVTWLRAIDLGAVPRNLEIQNLFEGDVFSWYLDVLDGNVDLLNGVREVLDALSTFALPRVAYGANRATDVLRDLYLVLVPRTLRKSLGEFLTPPWLAGACLERVRGIGASLDTGRVLDPTCGTGTFLMPVLQERIARLRATKGAAVTAHDVRQVLNGVVGFDINPVAVTAARVNYVVALGDLSTLGPLTLPVWRADSILLPDEPAPQITGDRPGLVGHRWQALRTSLPDPFPVPPSLATGERMAELRRCIEQSLEHIDPDVSRREFHRDLRATFDPASGGPGALTPDEWEGVEAVASELHQQILDLRDSNRNGVWARIIENSFAPLFAGKFDVVIGNPPWLTWTKTPPHWRAVAETVWRRYGLWQVPAEGRRRSRSLASGDMAILVFATAIHRFAAPDGVVGLLTPRALATGDPGGRAFRQFHLRPAADDVASYGGVDIPFRVVSADDWSVIKPFSPDASNEPYFLVARVGKTHEFPVPTTRWTRGKRGASLGPDWFATRPVLHPVAGASHPVDRSVPTAAWSFQVEGAPPLIEGGTNRWSFGKGLDTRGANGVYFVKILQSEKTSSRVLIENLAEAGRNSDVRSRRGWVEADIVHPLLRGRDVAAWAANPGGYIVAPYQPDNLGELLRDEEFREKYPNAWRWLRAHAPMLRARKAPPTRNWKLAGPDWCRLDGPLSHMAGANIVVVRELQQRPAAAVLSLRYDERLGRTSHPLIDHKLMFCSVDSPDEAVYLAAFINSTPIQDLLASYANQIAVSPQTLARLPIPDFDLQRDQPVVVAGREAIDATREGEAVDQNGIDELVIEALRISEYVPQPVKQTGSHRAATVGRQDALDLR